MVECKPEGGVIAVAMIGERLKMARRMAGLSQRALAQKADLSAMAISKYERDLNTPSSAVLIRLAQVLEVKAEFFLRPATVTIAAPSFRRRASLPRKQEDAILAKIQEWLERYLEVESLLADSPRFDLPPELDRRVESLEDVERVANGLRSAWELGQDAIENMFELLEDRGIKAGQVAAHDDFDAVTVWANDDVPVIVVKRDLSGDRQRFNLAHELGHLVLEPAEGVDAEKAALRFASAFLVPVKAARFELGPHRQALHVYELHLLKHKYGLSMQAWIYRAKDLGILSEAATTELWREFSLRGWRREEPGDQIEPEKPARMKRLVLRALAEDVISESRAAELLGMPLEDFWQQEAKQHDGFPADVHR